MKSLAFIALVFALAAGIAAKVTGSTLAALLTAGALLCALTTYRSHAISSFMKIFVAIFTIEMVVFGSLYLVAEIGFWPPSMEDYRLPESLPLTVAIFSILVYLVSFIPVVRSMTRIADRYFDAPERSRARIWPLPAFSGLERRIATGMVVFLVLINQAEVGMEVRLSFFSRDWFNAIQNMDSAAFWYQLFAVFIPWAFLFVASAVIEFVVQSVLVIRWRRWLTDYYVERWLGGHTHYRMSLISGGTADNPDQRIAEDVNRFIDGGQVGYGIYSFTILLISKLSSLVSFAIILWSLSANFTLPYTTIAVPGFLFWVALIYAGIGTLLTHLIGRPLVGLSFIRQRYEADFRFSLARLREYAEQVALLNGETVEKISLRDRFRLIIDNYFDIVACRKKLTAFTASYGQLSPIIPFIVAAPFYFAGKIQLGIMTQTARAFGSVDSSLTFFVTYYVSLAEYKAVLDRLISFDAAIDRAHALSSLTHETETVPAERAPISLDLSLHLPNGSKMVKDADFTLASGEATLLTGPSGSGKSTLLRAVAGIWPFGDGNIVLPSSAKVMLLPQKPYIPIGSLRAAITYPQPAEAFDEATIRAALSGAKLGGFNDKLDIEDVWSQRLSGGEQQRLAVARALLAKPDWLFLDEATAAMDESMEADLYKALAEHLPETTIVSIGHRTSLTQFHTRRLNMEPAGDGLFTPADVKKKAAE